MFLLVERLLCYLALLRSSYTNGQKKLPPLSVQQAGFTSSIQWSWNYMVVAPTLILGTTEESNLTRDYSITSLSWTNLALNLV